MSQVRRSTTDVRLKPPVAMPFRVHPFKSLPHRVREPCRRALRLPLAAQLVGPVAGGREVILSVMAEASGWNYRNEGNHNLVLASDERRVIRRILKLAPAKEAARLQQACGSELGSGSETCNGVTDAAAAAAAEQQKVADEVLAIARYYINVMKPLLQCYAVVPVPVVVGPQFIEQALLTCSSFRPDERKKSSVLNTTVCLELPDLCYLPGTEGQPEEYPTFAVEVKLKSGVCSLRAPGGGQSACLPCALYRHCKKNGVVTGCRATDQPYCPVDLFSGDRERMLFALRTSLRDCRLGTNRMRVFKNATYLRFTGQEKWSAERYLAALDEQLSPFFGSAPGSRCEALLLLVIDALLTPGCGAAHRHASVPPATESCSNRAAWPARCSLSLFPGKAVNPVAAADVDVSDASSWDGSRINGSSEAAGSGLPAGCVLDRVLAAQMLCSDSVDVVYNDCFLPLVNYLDENPAVAERLFSYERPHWDLLTNDPRLPDVDCEEKLMGHFLQVRNFLVSKTASDCSVMITLKPMGPADSRLTAGSGAEQSGGRAAMVLYDITGTAYRASTHVIDLDPKPLDKLPIYMDAYRQCTKALAGEAQTT